MNYPNEIYEEISDVLFSYGQVTMKCWVVMDTAASYLSRNYWHLEEALSSDVSK